MHTASGIRRFQCEHAAPERCLARARGAGLSLRIVREHGVCSAELRVGGELLCGLERGLPFAVGGTRAVSRGMRASGGGDDDDDERLPNFHALASTAVVAAERLRGRGPVRTGSVMLNVVPSPIRLSTVSLPPCASTICFAIASPSPVPSCAAEC